MAGSRIDKVEDSTKPRPMSSAEFQQEFVDLGESYEVEGSGRVSTNYSAPTIPNAIDDGKLDRIIPANLLRLEVGHVRTMAEAVQHREERGLIAREARAGHLAAVDLDASWPTRRHRPGKRRRGFRATARRCRLAVEPGAEFSDFLLEGVEFVDAGVHVRPTFFQAGSPAPSAHEEQSSSRQEDRRQQWQRPLSGDPVCVLKRWNQISQLLRFGHQELEGHGLAPQVARGTPAAERGVHVARSQSAGRLDPHAAQAPRAWTRKVRPGGDRFATEVRRTHLVLDRRGETPQRDANLAAKRRRVEFASEAVPPGASQCAERRRVRQSAPFGGSLQPGRSVCYGWARQRAQAPRRRCLPSTTTSA